MDDFTLLKDMADRTPLPSAADLAPARARLMLAITQPAATHSAATQPPATQPPATHPAITHPAITQPPATHSAATQPPAIHPPATRPPATQPAATQPAATQPAATRFAPVKPTRLPLAASAPPTSEPAPHRHNQLASAHTEPTQPRRRDEQLTTSIEDLRKDRPATASDRRTGRRRLVFAAVAVVGLAAAITGVVALGGLESVGVAPPAASAAEVLHQAADAARAQPATAPRPDQFVYARTQSSDGAVREAWLSADGTRDGLIVQRGERTPVPGCRDGKQAVVKGTEAIPNAFEPCTPEPAYRTDLPTDAAGMREFLKQNSTGQIGKDILYYVGETYVSPDSLAALFDVIADFPELTVDEHAKDGAGRPGIGVSWTRDGHTVTIVFDSVTHAFLGFPDAAVEHGIADAAGQQP